MRNVCFIAYFWQIWTQLETFLRFYETVEKTFVRLMASQENNLRKGFHFYLYLILLMSKASDIWISFFICYLFFAWSSSSVKCSFPLQPLQIHFICNKTGNKHWRWQTRHCNITLLALCRGLTVSPKDRAPRWSSEEQWDSCLDYVVSRSAHPVLMQLGMWQPSQWVMMFSALHSSVYHKTHDTTVIDSIITDIVMKMNVEVNSCSSVSVVDHRQKSSDII